MTDYRDAGVDVSKGEEAVERIKKHVHATHTKDVLKGVGAFAGSMSAASIAGMKDPVILASIDGVGTKTIIAEKSGKWEGVGHDIVNHSGNDLVCQGAKPLLFLDYVASSSLDPDILETIVKGMCDACKEIGCVLIGGETAEMPKVYCEGAHDIVGSIIGVVECEKMITGETIEEGDKLIALESNGLHTNGYSLARKVLLDDAAMDVNEVADDLLKPHTSYVNTVLKLHEEVGIKGIAHITGGGIKGNLARILPKGLGASINLESITTPPIFDLIQETGNISDDAMYEAFNMGVGMILVVGKDVHISEGVEIGNVTGGGTMTLL